MDNKGAKNVNCGAMEPEDGKKQPNHSPDARKYTGMEPKKEIQEKTSPLIRLPSLTVTTATSSSSEIIAYLGSCHCKF